MCCYLLSLLLTFDILSYLPRRIPKKLLIACVTPEALTKKITRVSGLGEARLYQETASVQLTNYSRLIHQKPKIHIIVTGHTGTEIRLVTDTNEAQAHSGGRIADQ